MSRAFSKDIMRVHAEETLVQGIHPHTTKFGKFKLLVIEVISNFLGSPHGVSFAQIEVIKRLIPCAVQQSM